MASVAAICPVLVQENNDTQCPVYYVLGTLQGAKTRYTKLEKLMYSSWYPANHATTFWCIQSWFHPPTPWPTATQQGCLGPNRQVGHEAGPLRPSLCRLNGHPISNVGKLHRQVDPTTRGGPNTQADATWTMYIDDSSCATRAGVATILVSPNVQQIIHAACLEFPTTNNAA